MAVTSLYTNIPTQDGILTVHEAIISANEFTTDETRFIIVLLRFVLCNYYCMFESTFHQQIMGTAMGCNMVPTFAVIYMNSFEEKFVYTHPFFQYAKLWLRYIDDVFIIWQGDYDSLLRFH